VFISDSAPYSLRSSFNICIPPTPTIRSDFNYLSIYLTNFILFDKFQISNFMTYCFQFICLSLIVNRSGIPYLLQYRDATRFGLLKRFLRTIELRIKQNSISFFIYLFYFKKSFFSFSSEEVMSPECLFHGV
jgi:hypothetical protein